MSAIVIEGDKKSDFDIFIALAKKLGLKVHLLNDEYTDVPNEETIKAMLESEKCELNRYENASNLLSSLKEKAKNA
ncbi:MAG: hypothetical protein WCH34_09915 [Bacteroidota bacterium]